MTKFASSDHHFGHLNRRNTGIIDYCNRPFKDINHMNESLIEQWNSVVGPDDEVYYLGDFAFYGRVKWLTRLNGKKILVRGNHDKKPNPDLSEGWQEICTYKEVVIDGKLYKMSHYSSTFANQILDENTICLFGHSHGTGHVDNQHFDVGIDSVCKYGYGYRPVTFPEILEILATLGPK